MKFKSHLVVTLVVFGLLSLLVPAVRSIVAPAPRFVQAEPVSASALQNLPLAFVPNQGQLDESIHFQAWGTGSRLAFSSQGVELALVSSTGQQEGGRDQTGIEQLEQQQLQIRFLGSNAGTHLEANRQLPTLINDLRGNDPELWYVNLPTYGEIDYRQLYLGIDLRYEGAEGLLKSTFQVAPGADPLQVRWSYEGADITAIDVAVDGNLVINLADGSKLVEQAPIAWQEIQGEQIAVAVAYNVREDGSVGFVLGDYDRSQPLTIDPTLVYETVFNSADFDWGVDIAADNAGNAYVVAQVYDTNHDIVVLKLGPDGTILHTTYLRGAGLDYGGAIAVDAVGDIYVVGRTLSNDFPVHNALQPQKNGPSDAFLTKLSGQDGSLIFSTYYGGSRAEQATEIALNGSGAFYITGATDSTDFPTTADAYQDSLNLTYCFCEDAFVSKISTDGQDILYSTYFGGGFDDVGTGIGLDTAGNIYFAGNTKSDDLPLQSPLQGTYGGGFRDGFVAKLSSDGQSLLYSTFLGGEEWERLDRVAVSPSGQIYLGGSTRSASFPTTAGAFQEEFAGGIAECGQPPFEPIRNCDDAFVSSILPDGSAFAYSTYLGGNEDDIGRGLAIDNQGNAYLIGYSRSDNFPVPGLGLQAKPDVTFFVFVSKLNASGSDLLFTLQLTLPIDDGDGITVDGNGDFYIIGGINVPSDLYIAKYTQQTLPPPTATPIPLPTQQPPADTDVGLGTGR
jgi:hypothetical protein